MIRLLTGALAALVLLVAAPSASAAITLTYDAGTNTIGIAGAGDNITYLGFSSDKVTVRNSSGVTNSTGGLCTQRDEPVLGTYFDCPSATAALNATYAGGNDELMLENVCIPSITAALGDGANRFTRPDGCPATQPATVTAGSGTDIFVGGNGPDTFDGGGGDDQLRGYGGDDVLRGGDGNDQVEGGDGNDQLDGGAGNDRFRGGPGNDTQDGGDGDDILGDGDADGGADDLRGGAGFDTLDLAQHATGVTVTLDDAANDGVPGEGDNAHTDIEKLFGTQGPDTITGSAGPDTINGGQGADVIRGGAGNDTIDGESDNDQIFGDAGNDTLSGGYGDDRVEGGAGTDSLMGDYGACSAYGCASGNDQLFSRDGEADALNCGGGADTAQVDAVDTIGQDGFQACETVDRAAAPAPQPPSGGGGGTPAPGTTTPAILAAGAKITAGKKRFTVVFTLRRAGTVTLTITKKGAKKALGKVTIKAKKGKTTRAITKVGKKKLAKGTYKVVLRVGSSTKTFNVKVR